MAKVICSDHKKYIFQKKHFTAAAIVEQKCNKNAEFLTYLDDPSKELLTSASVKRITLL